jgi:tetratricopeptide (TPR) repeat protein
MDLDQVDANDIIGDLSRCVASGDWLGAVTLTQRYLRSDREDVWLSIRMAEILSEANEVDAAEATLQQAHNRWPEDIWPSYHYADFLTRKGDFDVATARWQDLIVRHPELPHGLCGLASLFRLSDREDDAARLYEETFTRFPDYLWAAHGHALTSTIRRDWTEAARRWAIVRERFPDHLTGHVELLTALIEDARVADAEEVARLGVAAFPEADSLRALCTRLDTLMRECSVEYFILSVFQHLLQRDPEPDESARWVKLIGEGLPEREFFRQILNCHEYGPRPRVIPGHTPGSYYSPLVDPTEAAEYWRRSAASNISDLAGIPLDLQGMERFWRNNKDFMGSMAFAEKPGGATRYYFENGMYHNGDAVVLSGMIHQYRPTRVIEIGSGFSSAVIVDAVDRLGLRDFHLTCIDPDASRLRNLLRPEDYTKMSVIEDKVQEVPIDIFGQLQAGDILLIDSSHVMKTGSDVHYELFTILPVVRPGVIIHFHDVHFPFEYPESWVLQFRWAWNEAYVVRAFLAHNNAFRVIFFTDLFLRQRAELAGGVVPGERWPMNPLIGSSIWISRER